VTATQRTVRLHRAERRAQLLDAARTVFVDNGYHAAAMDDIAERAGVSKPILYKHFGSKLDLYLALLDYATDALVAGVSDALNAPKDNEEKVAAAIGVYFAFADDGSYDYRLVFESDATNAEDVRSRLDQANERISLVIARAIRRESELPSRQSEILGAALAGMAEVSARQWLAAGRPVSRAEAVGLVAGLAWRGIVHVAIGPDDRREPAEAQLSSVPVRGSRPGQGGAVPRALSG
jgi:AcrR family transcriptional regulator